MSNKPKRYVYITGCDSGFGRIAVDLFDKDQIGVFAGVFLEASIEKLKRECPSGRVVPVPLNVRSEASVLEAARLIKEQLAADGAQLIGVVNNAGILVQPCPAEWQSMQDFRDMIDVNLIGTAAVTQSVLPLIRASKGRIVCVSSIAGRFGLPTEAAYCASKYAVQGYADVLRRDMLCWGVSVHIVEPGVFPNTGLYERFEKGLDTVWARLDPQLRDDYGEDHYKFIRKQLTFALHEFGTTDTTLVSKAYVHAITSEQAMYRYRIGADSKYLMTLLSNVHESTSDALVTRSDPRMPYVKPTKAPSNGRELVFTRMDKGWNRYIAIMLIVAFVLYKVRTHGRDRKSVV